MPALPATLTKVGILGNHDTWITALSIADPDSKEKSKDPNLLLSASRDGLLKLWSVPDSNVAELKVVCKGHRDAVSSCRLSGNGQFAISCSWDRSMKVWSLASPSADWRELAEEVSSGRVDAQQNTVAISPDNRQILTGGGTKIHLWNTLAQVKFTVGNWSDGTHNDWVSAVEWVPSKEDSEFLSASWDHKLRLWTSKTMKPVKDFIGHQGVVHCIAISPDASLIASGGEEARVIFWDLKEARNLYELFALSTVNSVAFSPNRYWLAVATDVSVEVYDLENKQRIWEESAPPLPEYIPWATCLTWSGNGDRLFVGHSDGAITQFRVVDPIP